MREQLKRKQCFFVSIGWVAAAICLCAATAAAASHVDSTPQEVFDGMRGSFQAGKSKRCARSLSMGLERTERWRMVDRGKRRDLQNGKGENRPSERHFLAQATRIGSPFAMTNSAARGLILPAG